MNFHANCETKILLDISYIFHFTHCGLIIHNSYNGETVIMQNRQYFSHTKHELVVVVVVVVVIVIVIIETQNVNGLYTYKTRFEQWHGNMHDNIFKKRLAKKD